MKKTHSRQRSEGKTHKSTKKDTKEVRPKEKRRKSSRTAAEVKCRKETATALPARETNAVRKDSLLENAATGKESEKDKCGEVEKEVNVQPSSAKEVDKSDNHGEDTPTSTRAGCCENHLTNLLNILNRCAH